MILRRNMSGGTTFTATNGEFLSIQEQTKVLQQQEQTYANTSTEEQTDAPRRRRAVAGVDGRLQIVSSGHGFEAGDS